MDHGENTNMKKQLKKMMALVLTGAIAVFAAGCGASASKTEASAPQESQNQTVRVGVLSIDDSLPVFAAEESGAFAKAGLDVEVYPFKSSSDQSKAMEAGELDVAMNDMIVQSLMKKAGTDTKVVATAFGATPQEGRFVVAAAPGSGIAKPEDLVGKKVAISTNTMMEYLLNQYEDYYHLDKDSIDLVNMPNLMLRVETLLEGKDIDAAILPDPLASFAIQQGAVPVIDDTTLDENFSQSVFLASDDFAASHADTLTAFMNVLYDTMQDINDHPDNYRALALEKANVPESLKDSYAMPTFTPGALPTQEEVARVQTWLTDKGLIDQAWDYEELVTDAFAKAK